MIEAACTTCGNINRVPESELPAGAKFLTCVSCKSRVGLPDLPPANAMAVAVPMPTPGGSSGSLSRTTTSRPATPRSGPLGIGPARPSPSPFELDLAPPDSLLSGTSDLPAPKGALPPRSSAQPSSTGITDLPAPKGRRGQPLPESAKTPDKAIVDLPAPKSRPSKPPALPKSARTGPVPRPPPRPLLDLPAPKPRGIGELPPSEIGGIGDLPAPKRTTQPRIEPITADDLAELAPPPAASEGPPDLPGPRQRPGALDLPASRRVSPPDVAASHAGSAPDLALPKSTGGLDLPAPKRSAPDLLASKLAGTRDLPAPKRGAPDLPKSRPGGAPDLHAPKRAGAPDLPSSKRSGAPNRPAPKPAGAPGGAPDLHASPQGSTGVPAPKPSSAPDLPAPKGFFDDLPQPAMSEAGKAEPLAPKGAFDAEAQPAASASPAAELPAPKGFFDDLPGRPGAAKPTPPEAPAPKGFFDDLPGRPGATRPTPPEAPAPKGFFDDLPGRPTTGEDQPPHAASTASQGSGAPAEEPAASANEPDETLTAADIFGDEPEPEPPPPRSRPTGARGLESDRPPSSARDTPPAQVHSIDLPTSPGTPRPNSTRLPTATPPSEVSESGMRGSTSGAPALELDKHKADAAAPGSDATARGRRMRVLRVAAITVCGVLGLGVGGLVLYRRHAEQQARSAAVEEHLSSARTSFGARDPKRWERAAAEALQVLEIDARHPAAVGLAAEALLADAIAYGLNTVGKVAQARGLLATALADGLTGPEIERAQALSAAATRQPDTAKLEQLAAVPPQDPTLALYLGWAVAARGDTASAIRSFTLALSADALKIPALYGRARARLAQADLPGARADFAAILVLEKDNLAAQVGLAAAKPAAQAQLQEAELLAILQRKDLAAADPRAVLQAWTLAAEAARRAGRLEPARERYRKAQALAPQDVSVMTGLAEVELLDGKLDTADELLEKALAINPGFARALLVSAELALRQKRIDDATDTLQALRERKPPLPTLEQSRLLLISGRLLEAQGQDGGAADAYVEAAKLAGDLDLMPALTAVTKLGALAEAAAEAKELQRAAVLRVRAEQIIAGFSEQAKQDPQLSLALGLAFLQAGDATRAEPWLRLVVEARPTDAEVRYQLGRALARLGRTAEAIDELQHAGKLDEHRPEIGIELARIYEANHRPADANEIFAALLADKKPGIAVRASAGRFFARNGEPAKAGAQGALIYAIDPVHPAGLYLKAEAALAEDKLEEAAKLFRAAVDADRDPQYLDGQGRAAEAQAKLTGDTKFQEVALRAYIAAAAAAPEMVNPLLGQGRIYVERRDAIRAIPALLAASKLEPDHPEIARLIGLAYKEYGEREVAIEWLERAHRLKPTAETAWSLGQLHHELNQPRETLSALGSATRLGLEREKQTGQAVPWLTEALYRLGRIHMDSGNERAAKAAWEKYVGRNPKSGAQLDEVRRELATTLQRY